MLRTAISLGIIPWFIETTIAEVEQYLTETRGHGGRAARGGFFETMAHGDTGTRREWAAWGCYFLLEKVWNNISRRHGENGVVLFCLWDWGKGGGTMAHGGTETRREGSTGWYFLKQFLTEARRHRENGQHGGVIFCWKRFGTISHGGTERMGWFFFVYGIGEKEVEQWLTEARRHGGRAARGGIF